MKKLSDYKGEEAFDVLADIIEPFCTILADKDMQKLNRDNIDLKKRTNGKEKIPTIKFITVALKNKKKEVIQVMARIEGVTPEEYLKTVNGVTLPLAVLNQVTDPEVQNLFTLQSQTQESSSASSGSATENTEA